MASATVAHALTPGPANITPPANAGSVVLIPEVSPTPHYSSYYRVLAFLGALSQPTTTTINVPASPVANLQPLLVNLPNGVSTPLAEIGAAIYQYLVSLSVPPNAPTGFGPIPTHFGFGSLRTIVNGSVPASSPYSLSPAKLGSAILVPVPPKDSIYQSFYMVFAYLDLTAGATNIQLPSVPGILVVDLPNGIYTTTSEINAIAANGGGGGQPGGADGT